MKSMKKIRDQGVAIILALIFLAIFMILAFAFTARSILASRSATYQAADMNSQAMCESVLQQAISSIKLGYDNDTNSPFPEAVTTSGRTWKDITIKLPNTNTNYATKFIGFVDSTAKTAPLPQELAINFLGDDNLSPPAGTNNISWGYLQTPSSLGDNTRYNALYTWYAIPMSGRIDPNYTAEALKARGVENRELDATQLSWQARSGLTLQGDTPSSYKHEIIMTGLTSTASLNKMTSKFWKSLTQIGDQVNEDSTWQSFHPHNTVDKITAKSGTLFDVNYIPVIAKSGAALADDIIGRIPYLQSTPTGGSGIAADNLQWKRQIAANMRDFLDADIAATTNLNADGSSPASNVNFCGIEKVPLFSEIKAHITNSSYLSGLKYNIKLTVDFEVEVSDLYGSNVIHDSLASTLAVTLRYIDGTGGTVSKSTTKAINLSTSVQGDAAAGEDVSMRKYTGSIVIDGSTIGWAQSNDGNFDFVSTTDFKTYPFVAIKNGAVSAACDGLEFRRSAVGALSLAKTDKYQFSRLFLDPRAALSLNINSAKVDFNYRDDLMEVEPVAAAITPRVGNILYKNSDQNSNPLYCSCKYALQTSGTNIGKWKHPNTEIYNAANNSYYTSDYEPKVSSIDPQNFSTAKHRNSLITSLSQLGYVSRGYPYQTLNLISYNTAGNLGWGDNWALGDRNLLDNLYCGDGGATCTDPTDDAAAKIDPDTINFYPHSAINPNAARSPALMALFNNICPDQEWLNILPPVYITIDQATTLASLFPQQQNLSYFMKDCNHLKRNPKDYGQPFSAPNTSLTGVLHDTHQDLNDRDREELLWRTKNLINCDTTYYMIVCSVLSGYSLSSGYTVNTAQKSGQSKMISLVKRTYNLTSKAFEYSVLSREYRNY